MIRTFADPETERIFRGKRSRKLPPDIQGRALAKLALIDAAEQIEDLRNPPSNRLHALSGDRAGQHSVSINRQWRICFSWKDGHAYDVEIVDYH
jgi:proteic killer suppression protein